MPAYTPTIWMHRERDGSWCANYQVIERGQVRRSGAHYSPSRARALWSARMSVMYARLCLRHPKFIRLLSGPEVPPSEDEPGGPLPAPPIGTPLPNRPPARH